MEKNVKSMVQVYNSFLSDEQQNFAKTPTEEERICVICSPSCVVYLLCRYLTDWLTVLDSWIIIFKGCMDGWMDRRHRCRYVLLALITNVDRLIGSIRVSGRSPIPFGLPFSSLRISSLIYIY